MLHRIQPISRSPQMASGTFSVNGVFQFFIDVFTIVLPLVRLKDPHNPTPPSTNTTNTSTTSASLL